MSCDFGVWFPRTRLSNEEAGKLYIKLCEGDLSGVHPHSAVDAFYAELTALHPEIDTVPEERIDDHDYCPWSCALDRSSGHVIMPCVWSRAAHVEGLVKNLARKLGLAVFDPQNGVISYPDDPPTLETRRPWWRLW